MSVHRSNRGTPALRCESAPIARARRWWILAAALVLAWAGVGVAQAAPPVALGGGSGIVLGDGSVCTLTTIGTDGAGRTVGFTAGHCASPGAGVAAEADPDAGTLGTVDFVSNDLDYAVIVFDSSLVTPVSHVGSTSISGIGVPAQFPVVACKEGRTTGQTCGLVYGDVFDTATWTLTQICVIVGDSGAPVVVGSTLVAIVNGYIGVPCLGPQVGANFTTILEDVGARGGTGVGFTPV
ncbi:serine protease [Nocardia sp. NPDC058176]|uniref:serine protease n=1 Tax=Nocardia sp. NPDC058176 TaxID=3346368 RepID=UPI0036DDD460